MRKEVEVKAKLEDSHMIRRKLIELGCTIAEPIIQKDVIFVDSNYGPFEQSQLGKNILRIRESGGIFTLTLKQPQSNPQDAIEQETVITDPAAAEDMLNMMGYREMVRVNKTRRTTHINGWEICLDTIEGLGDFIEAELTGEDIKPDIIQAEMMKFFISLCIKPEHQITQGYDTLMYLKNQ